MLTTNGVPYDTAIAWSPEIRFAALVAIGEGKGGEFNWNSLRWAEK